MEAAKATPPSSCPVNHGAWLGSGSGSGSGTGAGTGTAASDGASAGASACPVRDGSGSAAVGVDPGNMMKAGGERNLPAPMQKMPLDTTRQTSTIPKSEYNPDHQDGTKNLWEYPSPQMFFNAMRRKGYQPSEQDMNMVVAIHNAVNERAWSEVLAWENLHTSSCGQPKLLKFEGRPKDLTPRARVKSWLGYALPFDRHDWTVDRCVLACARLQPTRLACQDGRGNSAHAY